MSRSNIEYGKPFEVFEETMLMERGQELTIKVGNDTFKYLGVKDSITLRDIKGNVTQVTILKISQKYVTINQEIILKGN